MTQPLVELIRDQLDERDHGEVSAGEVDCIVHARAGFIGVAAAGRRVLQVMRDELRRSGVAKRELQAARTRAHAGHTVQSAVTGASIHVFKLDVNS